MNKLEQAKRIMIIERECVLRQDTPACTRDCKKCDLVQDSMRVIGAYDIVIYVLRKCEKVLTEYEKVASTIKPETDPKTAYDRIEKVLLDEVRAILADHYAEIFVEGGEDGSSS